MPIPNYLDLLRFVHRFDLEGDIQLRGIDTPACPDTGNVLLYTKDGETPSKLYTQNDACTETLLTGAVTGTGVDGRVTFWTGTTTIGSDANFFFNSTDDWLAIGGAKAQVAATTGIGKLRISSDNNQGRFEAHNFGAANAAGFQGIGAGGTEASPSATSLNQFLTILGGSGYDNTPARVIANKALIGMKAAEAWTTTAQGTYITLETTPLLSTTRAERVRIDHDGKVGIGTSSPNEQLEITGNFRLPATTSTTGQIKSGANTLLHTFGSLNLFVGVGAGNLTLTQTSNVGVGPGSLSGLTDGFNNVGVGRNALNAITSGHDNVAIGALVNEFGTGNGNVSIGSNATAAASFTSSNNVAIGGGALQNLNSGAQQVAIGFQALNAVLINSNDTAIGYRALFSATNGECTGIGTQALQNTSTGQDNTALGMQAGLTNTTGKYNIYLGRSADCGATGLDALTVIGPYLTGQDSYYVVLGRSDQCVGIGEARKPSTGTAGLIFADGTALATMASNTAGLYADDVGGTVRMFSIDEAGNTFEHREPIHPFFLMGA